MAHANPGFRYLTPHRCGKCGDRLTDDEFYENRRVGNYGQDLRCFDCMAQAGGGNDPSTEEKP